MRTGVNARLNNTFGTNSAGISEWLGAQQVGDFGQGVSGAYGMSRDAGMGRGAALRHTATAAGPAAMSYFGGAGFTGRAKGMASAMRIGAGMGAAGMAGHMAFGNFSFAGAAAGAAAGGAYGGVAGAAVGGLAGGELFG